MMPPIIFTMDNTGICGDSTDSPKSGKPDFAYPVVSGNAAAGSDGCRKKEGE